MGHPWARLETAPNSRHSYLSLPTAQGARPPACPTARVGHGRSGMVWRFSSPGR
ncbi:Protein of unknown function [Pyronema omphalodes CBS 100304]|uniref:Uncharacterized protein n=1 Tax=Pyronema omphalodes (strain CBS 100304) TaxID=1076935 RepID=U4LT76_PYROM|nr:Protein of unknown function [Pyronema omphalodes CBS 100304]